MRLTSASRRCHCSIGFCHSLRHGRLSVHTGSRPDGLENSPLGRLPIELVQYMAESFPPQVAASFASTCRPILSSVGNQYLDRLWAEGHEGETVAFLSLLERDLSDHVLCFYCSTKQLHVGSKARHNKQLWPLPNNWRPACTKEDNKLHVESYIHQKFNFITFQSAMKRHRQGRCGVQLFLLSGVGRSTWTYVSNGQQRLVL